VGCLDAWPGHVLAEEDDVGLEHATAGETVDGGEAVDIELGQVHVPVGIHRAYMPGPPSVGLAQPPVELVAARPAVAAQADHPVERPVQLDHRLGPGRLVQAVDVLGDHPAEQPLPLHDRHRPMASVGGRARICRQPR